MTTKQHLAVTGIVVAGLLLAITFLWLAVAPKLEREKLGQQLDRIGLTILVDQASREK